MSGAATAQSVLSRARRLLARRDGWIEALADGYGIRPGGDRRSRVVLTFGEAVFLQLVETPGLRLNVEARLPWNP